LRTTTPAVRNPLVAAKGRRIVSFLQDMERETELRTAPSWKAHQLTGDRKGVWSLFVTKNGRMTFRIDQIEIEIVDLDYEDYHQGVAMNASVGIRMKRPAHPGGFVKRDIIEPLGLSVTRAAEALGVTRATLSTLVNARARLSPDMAVRIEKAFGLSMDTLMRMQNSYDIAQARARAPQIKVTPFQESADPASVTPTS
jgi:addiction module HigA family antidote